MRIQYISDVHLEHHPDHGVDFICTFPITGDVLVLAGDMAPANLLEAVLPGLCVRAAKRGTPVLMVAGNHEYWGSSKLRVQQAVKSIKAKCPNFYYLDKESVTIEGVKFFGSTMWFPWDPITDMMSSGFADFLQISKLRDWVFEDNRFTQSWLQAELTSKDVVITHHAPCSNSIAPWFRTGPNAQLNRFFLCDMSELILDVQPALWIHGHMHNQSDYWLGETHVVANPWGYPKKGKKNELEDFVKVIEL